MPTESMPLAVPLAVHLAASSALRCWPAQGCNLGTAARYASAGAVASLLPASAAGLGAAAGEVEELPPSGLVSPAVGGFSPGCRRAPVSSAGLAMAHSCGTAAVGEAGQVAGVLRGGQRQHTGRLGRCVDDAWHGPSSITHPRQLPQPPAPQTGRHAAACGQHRQQGGPRQREPHPPAPAPAGCRCRRPPARPGWQT